MILKQRRSHLAAVSFSPGALMSSLFAVSAPLKLPLCGRESAAADTCEASLKSSGARSLVGVASRVVDCRRLIHGEG
jgi:hypothetical protein